MSHLRLVAILAVAALAALAVSTWLPPTAETKAAAAHAVVRFETGREMAWPPGSYARVDLTSAQRDQIVSTTLQTLERYASGSALTTFDAQRAIKALVTARGSDPKQIVLGWRGEVVYLKVLRRTLGGKLVVRAGVRLSHEVGTWDEKSRHVVDRQWVEHDVVPVRQYTLGDYGAGWKVEDVQDWGRCAPDGSNVQEGPPEG